MPKCRAVIVVSLMLVLPRVAAAQSAGADETAVGVAAAQNMASAPPAGSLLLSGSLGFSLQAGRSEQLGYQADVIAARATRHVALMRLDIDVNRSEYSPAPGEDRILSDDNRTAALTVLPRWKPRFTVAAIASWRQDRPVQLRHRALLQAGPYFEPIANKHLTVALAPLVGFGAQDNVDAAASERIVAFGAMQSLTWRLAQNASLMSYGSQYRRADDAQDYAVLVNTSVNAALSRHFSFYVAHQYTFENLTPPGMNKLQQTLNAGIRLNN